MSVVSVVVVDQLEPSVLTLTNFILSIIKSGRELSEQNASKSN
ncbi:MAG: hypothetical protein AABX28_02615 [Nanoarchaeota archaeon]